MHGIRHGLLTRSAHRKLQYVKVCEYVTESLLTTICRPTPVECLSPFWAKSFPGYSDDTSKDGPGGGKDRKDISVKRRKKSPMTLSLADKRLFVVDNERVAEDGASQGRSTGAKVRDSKSCIVSTNLMIQPSSKTRAMQEQ